MTEKLGARRSMSELDSGRCTFKKNRIKRHLVSKYTRMPPFHTNSGIPFALKCRLILPDFLRVICIIETT